MGSDISGGLISCSVRKTLILLRSFVSRSGDYEDIGDSVFRGVYRTCAF